MKKRYCIAVLGSMLFANSLVAQLCTGSLGDPVVHITFGNSSTAAGPLKPGVTNMAYLAGTCPNDGQYTITNNSPSCFNFSWFTLSQDHTGDPGGRFMLINASFTPSDFYVDTVSGLCGNTIYEFATWAANVLRSGSCNNAAILPNLTFRIETTDGKILQQVESGDIPSTSSAMWRQYGTFFTTPAGTGAVILRITNNSMGGCGNDLMLDDITFRPCGPKITAYADNSISDLLIICEKEQKDIQFSAMYSTGFTDPVLQWQRSTDSGSTWTDIAGEQGNVYIRKPTAGGYYQYRVSIAERTNFSSSRCRTASNITTIDVPPQGPSYTALTGCTGVDTRIQATQGSGYTYQWSGPNGFSSTAPAADLPAVQYRDSGLYKVLITVLACKQTDSFYLKVFPNAKATVIGNVSTCEDTGIRLTASGGTQYTWTPVTGLSDPNAANPLASPRDTTVYTVAVTNQFGCRDSARTTVTVWRKPVVNAGPDHQLFEGESVALSGTVAGSSVSFTWSPVLFMTNSNSLSPTVSPEENTTYTLSGRSELGCGTMADEVVVRVYKKVKPPNVFSPNGDGINDSWVIPGIDTYPVSIVTVFGRNGLVVFQTRSNEQLWDGTHKGKPVPVGTYYYLINLNIGQPPLSGWVLVVR